MTSPQSSDQNNQLSAAAWWDAWWAEDFSSAGLENKIMPDGQRLAAFWGAFMKDHKIPWIEEHTIGSDGAAIIRHWTPFHLPYHFRDGSPTEKNAYPERYHELFETHFKTLLDPWISGSEPVFLDGIVTGTGFDLPRLIPGRGSLTALPAPQTLFFRWAHLPGEARNFNGRHFPGGVSFTNAFFSDAANFHA